MKQINLFNGESNEKGVAGIEILIEIVIGLFVLGILVFCITLMGAEISDQDSFYDTNSSVLTNATTVYAVSENSSAHATGLVNYPTGVNPTFRSCTMTVTSVYNATGLVTNQEAQSTLNYTIDGCYIYYSSIGVVDAPSYNNTKWNITGTYTFEYAGDEVRTINTTYQEIGKVVDWFAIIIIFGAVVVLILLTVLIIRTVRSSGLGGSAMGSGGRESA